MNKARLSRLSSILTHELARAVDVMARVQLGKDLSKEDTARMVAFLKTLTGERPSLALPIQPPSTAKTNQPAPVE